MNGSFHFKSPAHLFQLNASFTVNFKPRELFITPGFCKYDDGYPGLGKNFKGGKMSQKNSKNMSTISSISFASGGPTPSLDLTLTDEAICAGSGFLGFV